MTCQVQPFTTLKKGASKRKAKGDAAGPSKRKSKKRKDEDDEESFSEEEEEEEERHSAEPVAPLTMPPVLYAPTVGRKCHSFILMWS